MRGNATNMRRLHGTVFSRRLYELLAIHNRVATTGEIVVVQWGEPHFFASTFYPKSSTIQQNRRAPLYLHLFGEDCRATLHTLVPNVPHRLLRKLSIMQHSHDAEYQFSSPQQGCLPSRHAFSGP